MSDSEFAAQVAAKLESIAKEMDELQKLKAKLEDLQKHLGTGAKKAAVAPQVAEPEPAVTKPATVPPARRAQATAPKAKPAAKPPAKAAKSTNAKKKPRKVKATRSTTGRRSSTRADRVLGLLDEQPRTVAEMTKLLAQEHPEHAAPETAVRNTLETSLVAKGLAHRSKQGRTVFYSRPAAGAEAQGADAAAPQKEAASTPA
ncbi:hypothetical protein Sgleb_75070 [Streptomyces glebosus]|uniref:Regulatory protein n=1 Tax=Streptomyces glebosus TaxID=249580 RepID=A0A640T8D4_9ACTN|nr:hypothetical protein [Streptomyces glebosus]GFE19460.1 hypothetical protein Sgleb_75070 [Streptomyces glebosus]GHG63055.1 hypothetical protein GCM10010513_30270 [Streptomyces glebosus]